MTLSAEERRRIYEEEKVRLEAKTRLEAEERQKANRGWTIGCLIIIVVIGGLFAAAYYQASLTDIPIGSEVTLHGGSAGIGVPVDLDAFKEYWHAVGAHNDHTITRLMLEGRVILVDNGTKATTLSDGGSFYRVRITQGKHAGSTGYVQETGIKYKRPK